MKAARTLASKALVLAISVVVAPPALADLSITADGPYYASPSWSQKLAKKRFVVLADWNHEAVLDRETGLVWMRSPGDAEHDWAAAVHACLQANVGGRFGWRLPSLPEMASLAAVTAPGRPALPDAHPFENVPGQVPFFWTSTSHLAQPDLAYNFTVPYDNASGSFGWGSKTTPRRQWCVRGPGGGAP